MLDPVLLREQLLLASAAGAYDLYSPPGRRESAVRLAAFFQDLQRWSGADAFVEVGAHEAAFSREMARRFPGRPVVAFEGSPFNHAHFTAQIDFAAEGVDYRHALVSDRDGVAEIAVQTVVEGEAAPLVKGSDSMLEQKGVDIAYQRCEAPSVRLDTVFADRPDARFSLWIDVEGAQRQVLLGAEETLRRTRTLLIEVEEVEYWEGQWLFDDVQAHLAALGFIALARDFETRHQFNVVFIRPQVWDEPQVRLAFTRHLSRGERPGEGAPA